MTKLFFVSIAFLTFLALFPLLGEASVAPLWYSHTLLKVTASDRVFFVSADLADTFRRRTFGLMYRNYLPQDHGMIFEGQTFGGMWMKHTLIPLDILFVDQAGAILHIIKNAQPCLNDSCPVYLAPHGTDTVLEFNAGWVHRNKIVIGNTIQVD